MDNSLKIKIDGNTFTLLERGKVGGREHVGLKNQKGDIFAFYRSNSEGGIWRLCLAHNGHYEKGIDYVTSSFISMDLQMFINENYQKLENNNTIMNLCTYIFTADEMDERFLRIANPQYSDKPNRKVNDYAFEVLEGCKTADCFKDNDSVIYFKEGLKHKMDLEAQNYYRQKMYEKLDKIKKLKGERERTMLENINRVYKAVSDYMNYIFKCDLETIQYKGSLTSNVNNETSIIHKFYQIEIMNRINLERYYIYYSQYNYTNKKTPIYNGEYSIVLNVVPINTKTDEYGLYDKILSLGVYIYKIFDYKGQVTFSDEETKKRFVIGPSKESYIFIGDFMTNVWPLNVIEKESNIKCLNEHYPVLCHYPMRQKNWCVPRLEHILNEWEKNDYNAELHGFCNYTTNSLKNRLNYEDEYNWFRIDKDPARKKPTRIREKTLQESLNSGQCVNGKCLISNLPEDIEPYSVQFSNSNIIGEGSFGKIYSGKYKTHDGKIYKSAIKIIREEDINWKEVEYLLKLSQLYLCNDYVVCTYAAFKENSTGDLFIIMEYIDGKDLKDSIEDFTIHEKDLKDIFIKAIEGLIYIHSFGYAHSDLKLENIMYIPKTKKVKYIDFGLSCTGKEEECLQTYSISEVFSKNRNIQDLQKSDIWGLGIVLKELFLSVIRHEYTHHSNYVTDDEKKKYKELYKVIEMFTTENPKERSSLEKALIYLLYNKTHIKAHCKSLYPSTKYNSHEKSLCELFSIDLYKMGINDAASWNKKSDNLNKIQPRDKFKSTKLKARFLNFAKKGSKHYINDEDFVNWVWKILYYDN